MGIRESDIASGLHDYTFGVCHSAAAADRIICCRCCRIRRDLLRPMRRLHGM